MLRWILISALLAFSACKASKPINCDNAEQEIFDCIQSNNVRGDRALFEKCVSMDQPERFSGTWSTDFEWNQFYKGRKFSGDKAWHYQDPAVILVTEGSKLEKYVNNNLANVVEVEFIGRRPSCNLKGHDHYIVVDQVITDRVIEAVPSKW